MMDNSDNFSAFDIKLENDELIIKDEPEKVTKEHNMGFKFDINIPTNTDIKMDPSIYSNFPEGVASSKMDNSFNSDLQIKEEQKEEAEAHLVQESQVTFKCKINEEIQLEQEELIIKDEPEEVEELSSLEVIKYNTNPPTLGIRDRAANTEIKIDPSITRVEELLQICTSDVQFIRVSEQVFKSKMERYLNFNLQDNTGQQFEVEDCTAHQLPTFDFECKVCSLCVPLSLFKQHMLSHKDAKQKRGKQGEKNLNVYKRIRIGDQLFKCSKCEKCFAANYIKTHMLIHANQKLFKCQHCDKKFNLKKGLRTHMLFHENKRRFKCQQCDKGFNQNSDLKKHMLIHENKRPFQCQQCGKGFFENSHLSAHILIHGNKRAFKCSQCNKTFTRNDHLKSHMLIHENKRRFKCQQCGKSFNRNCDLKRHITLLHENKKQ